MAGNLRSPRKRALEIGTSADKFPADLPYDYQGGHPSNAGYPAGGGMYQEQAPAVGAGGGPLPNTPNPTK